MATEGNEGPAFYRHCFKGQRYDKMNKMVAYTRHILYF